LNYLVYWQSENNEIFSGTSPDKTPISTMGMDCYLFKVFEVKLRDLEKVVKDNKDI
jgi:hypothetical protein